jgi:hypothetical protein
VLFITAGNRSLAHKVKRLYDHPFEEMSCALKSAFSLVLSFNFKLGLLLADHPEDILSLHLVLQTLQYEHLVQLDIAWLDHKPFI